MKVLFITRNGETKVDPNFKDGDRIVTSAFPSPLSSFATMMLKQGFEVEIADATLQLKEKMYVGKALSDQRVLH